MKKKISILVVLSLVVVFMLTACGKSVKSESEMKKDLIGQDLNFNSGVEKALVGGETLKIESIKELKVTDRKTDTQNKQDTIFAEGVLSTSTADVKGKFQISYNLYDQGWSLKEVYAPEKVQFIGKEDVDKQAIISAATSSVSNIENIKVTILERKQNDDGSTHLKYEVEIPDDQYSVIESGEADFYIDFINKKLGWTYKNITNVNTVLKPSKEFNITAEKAKSDLISAGFKKWYETISVNEADIKSFTFDNKNYKTMKAALGRIAVVVNSKLEMADGEKYDLNFNYELIDGEYILRGVNLKE